MADTDFEKCIREQAEFMEKMGIKPLPFELPTYDGYTIDSELRQFRKVICKGIPQIDFVDFDSDLGKALLEEMKGYFSFLFESEGV